MLIEQMNTPSEEASFLRLVLDHISNCLVVVDTEGLVVLINQPYCDLLCSKEDDCIGRHITEVVGAGTKLHLVAQGKIGHTVYPLTVCGHELVTRQVPVTHNRHIVGAAGIALFSDVDALKQTYRNVVQPDLAIRHQNKSWKPCFSIENILGKGERFEAYLDTLRLAAEYEFPTLISGETGTGKELAAQAIHGLSRRGEEPFVWVNCASIPGDLIEPELFGYERGAFTGARGQGKLGKFELAANGTLFLDEIGDMPMHLQGSLLRVLQTNEIVRVGGVRPIGLNARVICATNHSLENLMEDGRFRGDLYYRLNVLRVHVPALRDRDDTLFLTNALLERIACQVGATAPKLSPRETEELQNYTWPGNVRELKNVLTRFLVTGEIPTLQAHSTNPEIPPENSLPSLRDQVALQKRLSVQKALRRTNGDKERAADMLDISRAQFYRILKTHFD